MKRYTSEFASLLECGQTIKTVAATGTPESLYPGVKQVFTVQAVADSSGNLRGTYFDAPISDNDTIVRFWFTVAGTGSAPSRPQNGTLSVINVLLNDNANAVAAATKLVVDADASFVASVATDTVTVTQANKGIRMTPIAGTSGFTVVVTTAGLGTRNLVQSVSLTGNKARDTANVGVVYLGFTATNDAQLEPLAAGKTLVLRAPEGAVIDLGKIFIDVLNAGDGILATWPAAERGN
jgi:hypothetical protein